jgi:hypothetical protein
MLTNYSPEVSLNLSSLVQYVQANNRSLRMLSKMLESFGTLLTLLIQGHDTTTSGICFALFALAKHQDVQVKPTSCLNLLFPKFFLPTQTSLTQRGLTANFAGEGRRRNEEDFRRF